MNSLFIHVPFGFAIIYGCDGPANTFGDPAATEVHVASPTLPIPKAFPLSSLLQKTVVLPVAIGAECEGQGAPGRRCPVLLSP
jgi:hypothetical protein